MSKNQEKLVYPEISQLKLRRLTQFDFPQFQKAVLQSKDSLAKYLEIGVVLPNVHGIDFMNFYSRMINDERREHYGVFHGWKLLACAYFCEAYDPSGIQIVYWVREAYLRQNIGTWTVGNMTRLSWMERDFHFSEMVIDETNIPSRIIALKHNYFPLKKVQKKSQGNSSSDSQIIYIHLNPKLNSRAAVHNKRPVDLIGHFCFIDGLEHLIRDETVNEYFRWKEALPAEECEDLGS